MKETAEFIVMRMVDANGNRAREALRVMEDFCRFGMNDAGLMGELKGIRHGLGEVFSQARIADSIVFRDTVGDVGTEVKVAGELSRAGVAEVVVAAGKRLSEALRVIEECLKTIDVEAAETVEKLRYRGYVVEQKLSVFVGGEEGRDLFSKVRVYVLLTDSLCHAAVGGWERMLDVLLKAVEGRAERLCVQLREKGLEDGELLRRAKIVAEKCSRAGALSIVNDRIDIALLSGADGVHLGQTDLSCWEVRRLAGRRFIVGVSTERMEQARGALEAGASYVAVGPMFETTTKEKPRVAGPSYAAEVVRALVNVVPVVAIGGIHAGNVGEVTAAGVKCVSVCSAIISQADPAEALVQLLGLVEREAGASST